MMHQANLVMRTCIKCKLKPMVTLSESKGQQKSIGLTIVFWILNLVMRTCDALNLVVWTCNGDLISGQRSTDVIRGQQRLNGNNYMDPKLGYHGYLNLQWKLSTILTLSEVKGQQRRNGLLFYNSPQPGNIDHYGKWHSPPKYEATTLNNRIKLNGLQIT